MTESTPTDAANRRIPLPGMKNEVIGGGTLVDASVVAGFLGVSRAYVYEHADELGARRLGSGPRARLRFSLSEVEVQLTRCPAGRESEGPETRVVEPKTRSRARSSSGSAVELLPIRGVAA